MSLNVRRRNVSAGVSIDSGDVRRSALEALSGPSASSHAKDDALSPRQFEQLVDASYDVEDDRMETECRMLLFLAGRVGLRRGEIAHLSNEWIGLSDGTITIPEHDRCTKGRHADEPCGYCRRRAKDRVDTANVTHGEAVDAIRHVLDDPEGMSAEMIDSEAESLRDSIALSMEDALAEQWRPKTPTSARRIPFDFDVRVDLALRSFSESFNGWEPSAATINRRIDRVAEMSDVDCNVYPHSLRATAASYHASRNISVHSLMSIMGWADPGTARVYVTGDAESAAREVRSKHR